MKIDIVKASIILCFSALISWGFYELSDYANLKLFLALVTFFAVGIPSFVWVGISFDDKRVGTMIKTASSICFFLGLIMNLIFSFFNFKLPLFFILNGVLLLIFLLSVYSMHKAEVM